ncbi:MAG: flavin reductase family protein [Christensenellales bacterium]|jgi:flavin reductase (DIM6/NTAB) family NADH-FMN oxidoreductase RutF
MSKFKISDLNSFDTSPFRLIGKEHMLITAAKGDKANTMTASWGGLGVIWGQPAAYIVIRPQRYTKEFVDAADCFSLSFLGAGHRQPLAYLGSVSGRDEDKITKSGLTLAYEDGVPFFEESHATLICKKAYGQYLEKDCFIEKQHLEKWYPESDLHMLYIGIVEKLLIKEQ